VARKKSDPAEEEVQAEEEAPADAASKSEPKTKAQTASTGEVLVQHASDATGPALLGGRLVHPGERHRVQRWVFEQASAAHPGRFAIIEEVSDGG
jgi:hypothetical protein